jgi:uncharacterized protein
MVALERSRAQVIKFLLENGADVNLANANGMTPLMQSVDVHTDDVVRSVDNWRGGPGYNDATKAEQYVAAIVDQLNRIVSLLLANRANIKARDEAGRTALFYLIEPTPLGSIKKIYTTTTDFQTDEMKRVLAVAQVSYQGRAAMIKLLLDAGVEIDLQDRDGKTALMIAASQGDLQSAKALIAAKAKLKLTDNAGSTAYQIALSNGHTELALLLKAQE